MTRVLILGASGYVGGHLAPRLAAAGHDVRAAARRVDALRARGWDGVECVRADALELDSLKEALDGVDIAYYLVHSMAAGKEFSELDRRAAANFRDAAADVGVRRIIYLGGLQPPVGASPHLASRLETGEILRGGPVPVTELRAGIVVGPGSAAFEVIRDLVYHLPVMLAPRWVRSRSQPIALDDLLAYLVGLLAFEDDGESHTYDAVGPETLSYGDLLRQFGAVVGREVRIVPLPVLSPRLSSYWLDLVTAVPASIARPLIDGLKHDLVSERPDELRELTPIDGTSYREAVAQALEEERSAALTIRWTEGGFRYRRQRHDVSWFDKSVRVEVSTARSADQVWDDISSIGGARGWYYATWLWRLRGAIDRLLGGVGMRRGRRHPTELRVDDPLDFWRVAAVEPDRSLTLVAEMKLPGSAVLELSVRPDGDGSIAQLQAHFHPAGVWGLVYWYALWPIHMVMFRRLAEALANGVKRRAGVDQARP
ncbi:MAG: SDR family oxidoreductase [Chloroflexi bacterium]|nr:SDR family oxidoreductase [Chloroflexota bacterium]MYF80329.1 SDR family oxidoreductase [Chloroflexota bacterium]MYI03436.1 SDR family oxidoreductase [Chloroflexota bacterium]